MLWFFEKPRARLRFEIRRDTNGPAYELVITYSDGRQEVERFPDTASVVERSRHL